MAAEAREEMLHEMKAEGTGRTVLMDRTTKSSGLRYLDVVTGLVERLATTEWPHIQNASALICAAYRNGGKVHAFGTGHSHMLAEELFYRAGGLVDINPIIFDGLTVHNDPELSTSLERLPGLAAAILDSHGISVGDVLIAASNSGGNAAIVEMAQLARALGASVIAVTSLSHATSESARRTAGARLHDHADVVIDTGGRVGDAAISIDGFDKRVAPTSTVIAAAVVNSIVAEVVEQLIAAGERPDVYTSANLSGGDADNARLLALRGVQS